MFAAFKIFNIEKNLKNEPVSDFSFLCSKLNKQKIIHNEDVDNFIRNHKKHLISFYKNILSNINIGEVKKISQNQILQKTENFKFKKIFRKFIFTDLFILDMLQTYYPKECDNIDTFQFDYDNIPFGFNFFYEDLILKNSFTILILLSIIENKINVQSVFIINLFKQHLKHLKIIFGDLLESVNSKYLLWKDTDIGGYVICNCENYIVTQGETKQDAIQMIKEAEELLMSNA